MALWRDDTALYTLSIFADKDIAKRLQAHLEDGLIRHLSDVGRLCVDLFGSQQMANGGIVNLHQPIINEVFPDGKSFTVIMILCDDCTIFKFRLFMSPFA